MAISNVQQARQMYNKGSKKPVTQAGVKNFLGKQEMVTAPKFWLSEPDHVKAKLAYITDEEEKILIDKNLYGSLKGKPNKGPAGLPSLQGGDAGGLGGDGPSGNDSGGDSRGDARDRAMGLQGKTGRADKSLDTGGGFGNVDRSKVGQFSQYGRNVMTQNLQSLQPSPAQRAFDFYKKYSPLGLVTRGVTNVFGKIGSKFGPKSFTDKYGYATDYQGTTGPSSIDDDDDNNIGGEGGMPLWMQLGFPSQAAYLASLQPQAGLPAAKAPTQTMNLNRIAYRLMADGGFLDDEIDERQAYGLGSIVKKAFKTVRKPFKAVTKTLKKVAKSPLGKIALAVAAPYALGPAVGGSQFLAGLSAAQKAALISGATTGITQLASGEDLDLKDIALSAAIGGVSASAFPPGGKPGVDGKAFNAARTSAGRQALDPSTLASRARVASDVAPKNTSFLRDSFMGSKGKGIVDVVSSTAEDPSLFTKIAEGVRNIGGKGLEFAKENPFLTIAGASGLAGLMAKQQEQEEFEKLDRGPGIDIDEIRRRPFKYMAPRFAGSQFDFYAADGGRIGYQEAGAVMSEKEMKKLAKSPLYKGFKMMYGVDPQQARDNDSYKDKFLMFEQLYKKGFQKGGKAEPVAKKVMPLLDMGGMEKDYRAEGGFVPIGRMEKADDVPARLSKNEFVFTADAVRNAGDGDVDKGAEVMYNMMKNLEAGGDVSEESQGLQGARRMFQTSQRLEEVL